MCERCVQSAIPYTPSVRIGGGRGGRYREHLSNVADNIAWACFQKGGSANVLVADRDLDVLAEELAERSIVLRERNDE